MKNELLAAGSRIKEKHKRELKAMKDILCAYGFEGNAEANAQNAGL